MNKRTILHFLCGYLMLLLGVLVLLVPFCHNTLSLFESKQMNLAQEQLSSGIRQLEQQLESLHGIAYSIGQDAEYRTMARNRASTLSPADYYRLQKLHTDFSRLCIAQPYAEDYGLLLSNGMLFTSKRIHLPNEDYYGRFIRFGDMDKEIFLTTFGQPSTLWTFLPCMEVATEKSSTQAVVWVCSMSQTLGKNATGILFATFSASTLADLIMPDFEASEAGFELISGSGEVLLRHGLDTADPNLHMLTASSSQNGLFVRLYLSSTLFSNMMRPAIRLLVISCALLILAGLVLSAVLAIRSSKPVHRLVALASQIEGAEPYAETHSSFDYIGQTVTSLATSIDEYKQALSTQQLLVRDHVFESMLRETPIQESGASQRHMREFHQCFPHFPSKYQLALIVLPDAEQQLEKLPQHQVALLSLMETQLSPPPYVFVSGRKAVAVLNSCTDVSWVNKLAALRCLAQEKLQLTLMIALSDTASGCEKLHATYQSVQNIMRCAGQDDGQLLDAWQRKNFPHQARSMPLDYAEMSQLHTLLMHAEKAGALSLLRTVYANMYASTFLDEVMNRQVYYNIRSVLLRMKAEHYELLSKLDIPDYHGELSNERLLDQLSSCCETICDLIQPALQSQQTAFVASVFRFIDDHLGDSMLCVRMVADHFSISEPTLQKAIRQGRNCTFFDYVEQQRYERALLLLKTSTHSIAQIAEMCGFNSTNAFYKAFKRKSSITPAAVRQQAKTES